jgi:ATP dependent DNA ligase domain
MLRVARRSASVAIKTSVQAGHLVATSLVPRWTPPQLCQLVEVAPSGPQWVHEIKIDGFRMAARTERGRVQLLTRTGLDWSDKYPAVVAALAKLPAKAAYLDGELCGIGDDGLPSFSQTRRQATAHAKDDLVFVAGERGLARHGPWARFGESRRTNRRRSARQQGQMRGRWRFSGSAASAVTRLLCRSAENSLAGSTHERMHLSVAGKRCSPPLGTLGLCGDRCRLWRGGQS